jgi:sodium transport system permease protein
MEIRSALRERNIVINSLLLPLLLYPAMLWLMLSGFTFVQGQTAGLTSRVQVVGEPALRDAFADRLRAAPKLEVMPASDNDVDGRIRAGEIDAVVVVAAASGSDSAPALVLPSPLGSARFSARYDASKDRSRLAADRVREVVDNLRRDVLLGEAAARGIGEDAWQAFHVGTVDTASREDIGALILKLLVPTILMVMVSLGCFYPAIDTTAGERERNTWETALSVSASRASIVTAKYFYVATFGAAAGLLNIVAMVLSLGPIIRQFTKGAGDKAAFTFPISAIPVTAAGTVIVALFVAAGLMILASFARTFKEGQSMASPFYLATMLPIMLLQSPDVEFTPVLALIPVANVAMVVREAIAGVFNWPLIALTAAVEIVAVAACLFVATRVLAFEDVLVGGFNGSFFKFASQRLGFGKRKSKGIPG